MKNSYMIVVLIILSVVSLFIGVKELSLTDILNFNENIQILFLSRIPRLISIIIAGVGMSISGLIMRR